MEIQLGKSEKYKHLFHTVIFFDFVWFLTYINPFCVPDGHFKLPF